MTFYWRRHDRGPRYGILWTLHDNNLRDIGTCFFLGGSRRYRCSAAARYNGGAVLTDYYAGTARGAMRRLERDWDKRSIGLFQDDDIKFMVLA